MLAVGTKVSYIDYNVEAKNVKVGDEFADGTKVAGVKLAGAWATFTLDTGATTKATKKTKLAVRVYGTVHDVSDDYIGVLTATYANGGFKIIVLVNPAKVEAA